ncbi:MAG: type II toxin-antitoxin system HicA family toxin [Nitrospira sp.]|nr:type II toxin-antitoxin system HicA family toxin [Nitrospira sp.]
MKRKEFIRELEQAGCELTRNKGGHDMYFNPGTGRSAPVPRHMELDNSLSAGSFANNLT